MHPSGFEVQLAQPLDFYAVTDHAQMLGLIGEAADTSTTFSDYELSESYHGINDSVDGGLFDIAKRNLIFNNFRSDVVANLLDGTFSSDVINSVSKSAWVETVNAATKLIGLVSSPPLLPMNTHRPPRNQGTFTAM